MLCHPSRPSTCPSTAPWGHQLRRKNMRMDSTIAITMPSSTPNSTTPAVATSDRTNADLRTRRYLRSTPRVHQRQRRGDDHSGERGLRAGRRAAEFKNSSSITTRPAPTTPVSWLFAPDCSATAVREPLVDTEKPWNRPDAMLAAPSPIISWSGSTSSPRRAAKLVAVAMVSVSDTSVMPTAAIRSGQTSLEARPRHRGRRNAAGERPHGRDAVGGQVERGRDDGRTDDGDQDRRDLRKDRGGARAARRGPPTPTASVVASVSSMCRKNCSISCEEPVGVGREAEQLRQLAHDDGDAEAVHVPDLHLAREQVGDESELAQTEADLDESRPAAPASPRVRSPSPGRRPRRAARSRRRSTARSTNRGRARALVTDRTPRSRPGTRPSCTSP